MTIRQNKFAVDDLIAPKNVLLSVFYKDNLKSLITGIMDVNPDVVFYSTGGTGKAVIEAVGEGKNYVSIEKYTNSPEMEGGLVKTLHPKVHAGLLGERGNPQHELYLYDTMNKLTGSPGVYFDVMVGNLYPFEQKIREDGATVEEALEAAGLSPKTSESVRVNGEDVDLDYELSDGERVMLVKDIRGGGKIGKN